MPVTREKLSIFHQFSTMWIFLKKKNVGFFFFFFKSLIYLRYFTDFLRQCGWQEKNYRLNQWSWYIVNISTIFPMFFFDFLPIQAFNVEFRVSSDIRNITDISSIFPKILILSHTVYEIYIIIIHLKNQMNFKYNNIWEKKNIRSKVMMI